MLTDNDRFILMLTSLEDIAGVISRFNIGLDGEAEKAGIILHIDGIVSGVLKKLERGAL